MGKNISGVIYPWDYFAVGSSFWTICPRCNYVSDKSSERQFSSGVISRGILSRRNYLWGNFLGAIIWGTIMRGSFPWGLLSSKAIVRGTIIWGGDNHPGVNCLRGNCPRTKWSVFCFFSLRLKAAFFLYMISVLHILLHGFYLFSNII